MYYSDIILMRVAKTIKVWLPEVFQDQDFLLKPAVP